MLQFVFGIVAIIIILIIYFIDGMIEMYNKFTPKSFGGKSSTESASGKSLTTYRSGNNTIYIPPQEFYSAKDTMIDHKDWTISTEGKNINMAISHLQNDNGFTSAVYKQVEVYTSNTTKDNMIIFVRYIYKDQIRFMILHNINQKAIEIAGDTCDMKNKMILYNNIKSKYKSLCDMDKFFKLAPVITFDAEKLLSIFKCKIAPKLDGTTALIYYDSKLSQLYHISGSHIQFVTHTSKCTAKKDFLLLCEYVNKVYYVLDILIYDGINITSRLFNDRFSNITKVLLALNDNKIFKSQIYYEINNPGTTNDSYIEWKTAIENVLDPANELPRDGIIIQPNTKYYDLSVMKWKPYTVETTDYLNLPDGLYIKYQSKLEKKHKSLGYDITIQECKDHMISDSTTSDDTTSSTDDTDDKSDLSSKYITATATATDKPKANEQTVHKLRRDKSSPNSHYVYNHNQYVQKCKWTIDYILGKTIDFAKIQLRKAQSVLYTRVKPNSTLVDIGTGTGRSKDLWIKKKLKVIAIETNLDNVEILKRTNTTKQIITLSGADKKIQTMVQRNVADTVYMSYSLTFFFKDDNTLEDLVSNINHVLKPGGLFICIGWDGKLIKQKLDEYGPIDNKAFSLSYTDDDSKNEVTINIKSANTLVENQIEYFTDYDKLTKALSLHKIMLQDSNVIRPYKYLAEWPAWFVSCTRYSIYKKVN